jgi:hypothetical protein
MDVQVAGGDFADACSSTELLILHFNDVCGAVALLRCSSQSRLCGCISVCVGVSVCQPADALLERMRSCCLCSCCGA